MSMKNKICVITGAGSGIGEATAIALAKEGAKVALVARREEKLQDTLQKVEKAGGQGLIIPADVALEKDVQDIFKKVSERWGDKVDYLLANAGVNGVWAPIEELSVEEYDRTLNINLRGTFMTIKYAVPWMKKNGGSIVVVSSINGTRTFSNSGATAYSTSKAGQVAMAKMLALELVRYKIRVNIVCPGRISTDIQSEATEKRHLENLHLPVEFPKGNIPLSGSNEGGTSGQVAELIHFLLSDKADHITGSEMWIDGGESLLKA